MSDMIERVAKAIHEVDILEAARRYPAIDVQDIRSMAEDLWGDHLAMARAAVDAMADEIVSSLDSLIKRRRSHKPKRDHGNDYIAACAWFIRHSVDADLSQSPHSLPSEDR